MFTANSMNCLAEALGLALPGNGSTLATHADREGPVPPAGQRIVELAKRYYEQATNPSLPRGIATFDGVRERDDARHRHGRLDQHGAAPAGHRPRGRGRLHAGRHRPPAARCRASARSRPPSQNVHMEDVHRAGGIFGILGELDRAGKLITSVPPSTPHLGEAITKLGHHHHQ
jgi:dihydroxy-acid dehydratase